jgi:hypothetical protein
MSPDTAGTSARATWTPCAGFAMRLGFHADISILTTEN